MRLGPYLELLEDPQHQETIESVAAPARRADFESNEQAIPNFGFTASAMWARFELVNRSAQDTQWVLELNYARIGEIALYFQNETGHWEQQWAGTYHPSPPKIRYRNPSFRIALKAQESQVFYLWFPASSVALDLTLWEPIAFAEKVRQDQSRVGIYYGSLLIMWLYNFVLFLSLRDRNYLYYLLYVLGFLLWMCTYDGLTEEVFGHSKFWTSPQLGAFLVAFHEFWLVQFGRGFLKTRVHAPLLDRWLILLMVVLGIEMVLALLLGIVISRFWLLMLIPMVALVVVISLFVAALRCWLRNYRPAFFFLVAFSTIMVGASVLVLKLMAVLPSNVFTENALFLGAYLEIFLLALALTDRFKVMKEERELALQQQLAGTERIAALNHVFQKFVPYEFLNFLQKEEVTDLQLGDCIETEMTVLFIDIRAFTQLSEQMTPEANFQFINEYLSQMGPVIREHQGFVDKYIGDAIVALFPQADDAVQAAVAMLNQLSRWNASRKQNQHPTIRVGIGINTGKLMLGTVGERHRMEGTVISDAVNLASRLEGLTKRYGVSLVVSENTFFALKNQHRYAIRCIDRVLVAGKKNAVSIFEVYEGDSEEMKAQKQATVREFEEARSLFHLKRFQEAEALFANCLVRHPEDPVAAFFQHQCEYHLQHGWDEHWDGVTQVDTK